MAGLLKGDLGEFGVVWVEFTHNPQQFVIF